MRHRRFGSVRSRLPPAADGRRRRAGRGPVACGWFGFRACCWGCAPKCVVIIGHLCRTLDPDHRAACQPPNQVWGAHRRSGWQPRLSTPGSLALRRPVGAVSGVPVPAGRYGDVRRIVGLARMPGDIPPGRPATQPVLVGGRPYTRPGPSGGHGRAQAVRSATAACGMHRFGCGSAGACPAGPVSWWSRVHCSGFHRQHRVGAQDHRRATEQEGIPRTTGRGAAPLPLPLADAPDPGRCRVSRC